MRLEEAYHAKKPSQNSPPPSLQQKKLNSKKSQGALILKESSPGEKDKKYFVAENHSVAKPHWWG